MYKQNKPYQTVFRTKLLPTQNFQNRSQCAGALFQKIGKPIKKIEATYVFYLIKSSMYSTSSLFSYYANQYKAPVKQIECYADQNQMVLFESRLIKVLYMKFSPSLHSCKCSLQKGDINGECYDIDIQCYLIVLGIKFSCCDTYVLFRDMTIMCKVMILMFNVIR